MSNEHSNQNQSEDKPRVLLVEDDALVRIVHSEFLVILGCSVETAVNGTQAIDLMDQSFDLIFMDMGLPDILGTEVVKIFRTKSKINKTTPIIALTGYSSQSNKLDFFDSGVNEIIVKPVLLEKLDEIIKSYL